MKFKWEHSAVSFGACSANPAPVRGAIKMKSTHALAFSSFLRAAHIHFITLRKSAGTNLGAACPCEGVFSINAQRHAIDWQKPNPEYTFDNPALCYFLVPLVFYVTRASLHKGPTWPPSNFFPLLLHVTNLHRRMEISIYRYARAEEKMEGGKASTCTAPGRQSLQH